MEEQVQSSMRPCGKSERFMEEQVQSSMCIGNHGNLYDDHKANVVVWTLSRIMNHDSYQKESGCHVDVFGKSLIFLRNRWSFLRVPTQNSI